MNVLALFAGIGGIELGLEATGGFRTVCCVEHDPYAVEVLKARMQEGALEEAPIWDDVTTFDGRPWCGLVDVVTGGFPCQDLSYAGKGAGIKEGTRSGLWSEMLRIIREVRPRYVLVENVPALLSRGLGRVLGDLAASGYDADWDCVAARAVGAPHRRDRILIVAHADEPRPQGRECGVVCERAGELPAGPCGACPDPRLWWLVDPADVEYAEPAGLEGGAGGRMSGARGASGQPAHRSQRPAQPYVGRVAHGVPARVHRLRCLGNAVVPQVAYYVGLRILAFHDSQEGR
jgi:DNA (cytosine-5)-methyltransferase 1